jgi:hypothetical protein
MSGGARVRRWRSSWGSRHEDLAGGAAGRLGRRLDPRDRLDGLADRDAECGQYLAQDGLVGGADRLVALAAAVVADRLADAQLDEGLRESDLARACESP